MSKLVGINKSLGLWVSLGFVIAQIIILITIDPHVILIGFLTAGIFLPFFVLGIVSTLDRTKHANRIKLGLQFGVGLLIFIPIFFPLFFDRELIYISLIGVGLGILTWYLRKKIEILFLIYNSISGLLLLLLAVAAIIEATN